ncbi:MAG TPA: hypothetical protein VGR61_03010 [Candidatus Dormibacteraeota bacterium]|nr:hypothetical protein [Candidatus Dormibacteraeota bacterium]
MTAAITRRSGYATMSRRGIDFAHDCRDMTAIEDAPLEDDLATAMAVAG